MSPFLRHVALVVGLCLLVVLQVARDLTWPQGGLAPRSPRSGGLVGAAGGPNSLSAQPSLLQQLRLRSDSLTASGRPKFMACAQVRDMINAAQVWVAFHVLQGLDEVVFYDDGSEPPLKAGDFGGLAPCVRVVRWHDYSATPASSNHSQQHTGRQSIAYHKCANKVYGNNTVIMFIDVDEFLFNCDGSDDVLSTIRGHAADEVQLTACPRFGGLSTNFNERLPVLNQLTQRAPIARLGEAEYLVKRDNPDCGRLKSRDEPRGICFSATAPKAVLNMAMIQRPALQRMTVHGIKFKAGEPKPPYTTVDGTRSRTQGLCCNHYFVRDDAEAMWKSRSNVNDFYARYVDNADVRRYYHNVTDTMLRDQWGARTLALLQEAGLPFGAGLR